MQFNGASLIVPDDGIYYIYGQLVIAQDDERQCEFEIETSSQGRAVLLVKHPASTADEITIFGSQVLSLMKKETVTMSTCNNNCSYSFQYDRAHFGLFGFN